MMGALQLAVVLVVGSAAGTDSGVGTRVAVGAAAVLIQQPEIRKLALPRAQPRPLPNDWFSHDKYRHFAMAFATTGFAYGGARLVGLDRDASLPAAIAAGSVASIGKELHDRRKGGPVSIRDLVWDAAGIAASALLLRSVR